jgi:acyl-CoA thioesterase I
MIFVPMSDLVPDGDPSLHQQDLIHPSPKGSAAIAARLAAAIRANDG